MRRDNARMNTKEEALENAQAVADQRGTEMFVIYDPKGKDQSHAYSVHTKASAEVQIGKGCLQIAKFTPGLGSPKS